MLLILFDSEDTKSILVIGGFDSDMEYLSSSEVLTLIGPPRADCNGTISGLCCFMAVTSYSEALNYLHSRAEEKLWLLLHDR